MTPVAVRPLTVSKATDTSLPCDVEGCMRTPRIYLNIEGHHPVWICGGHAQLLIDRMRAILNEVPK